MEATTNYSSVLHNLILADLPKVLHFLFVTLLVQSSFSIFITFLQLSFPSKYSYLGFLPLPPQVEVTARNVESVAESLNNALQQSDKDDLTLEDVQDIAETFRNIVDVESVTPEVRQYRKQY